MSTASSESSARSIVDEVLGRGMTKTIWTGNYDKVLPLSVQDFDLTAVLPAIFYMFRFGHRRGKGRFLETFGGEGTASEAKKAATIERVASVLAEQKPFTGFETRDSGREGDSRRPVAFILPGKQESCIRSTRAGNSCCTSSLHGELD